VYTITNATAEIKWIEVLQQTPISDYGKNAVWSLILLMSNNYHITKPFKIIKGWLDNAIHQKHCILVPTLI
jgi:hypothetical protein